MLVPAHSDLISTLIPRQTYLHIGSQILDLNRDIDQNKAVLLIENDLEYQRIDQFKSLYSIFDCIE